MGDIKLHRPVLLVAAISSQYDDGFDWAHSKMQQAWGKIQFATDRFDFTETNYYAKTMGPDLKKQLVAFQQLVEPETLAAIKLKTNELESEYAAQANREVSRPLNIDPGYLTEAKLILATTKDRDHRIYLAKGIYAEVTLTFRQKSGWEASRWTYPDFQRDDFHLFFTKCRTWLRELYRRERVV